MELNEDRLYNYLAEISKEGRFKEGSIDLSSAAGSEELDYMFKEQLIEGQSSDYQNEGRYDSSLLNELKLTPQGQSMLEKLENRW